jgi:hypothetical protein
LSLLFILSSTKLDIRAKQFLPGSEVVGGGAGEGGGRGEGRGVGKGEEMTQTLYAHMNKQKKKRRNVQHHWP